MRLFLKERFPVRCCTYDVMLGLDVAGLYLMRIRDSPNRPGDMRESTRRDGDEQILSHDRTHSARKSFRSLIVVERRRDL